MSCFSKATLCIYKIDLMYASKASSLLYYYLAVRCEHGRVYRRGDSFAYTTRFPPLQKCMLLPRPPSHLNAATATKSLTIFSTSYMWKVIFYVNMKYVITNAESISFYWSSSLMAFKSSKFEAGVEDKVSTTSITSFEFPALLLFWSVACASLTP